MPAACSAFALPTSYVTLLYLRITLDSTDSDDGHDFAQILPALDAPHNGMPKAIVAHTVKGKGVSFMENTCKWHGTAPNHDQLEEALKEIQYNA